MAAKKKPYAVGVRSLMHVAPELSEREARVVAVALGEAMMRFAPVGGWTPKSASDFVAQTAHESGGFIYRRELWNPRQVPAQAGYWRRRELQGPGPLWPGMGYVYRGAGYVQVTGRANFRVVAKRLGVSLGRYTARCGTRKYAALAAAAWWDGEFPAGTKGMTVLQVTKRVNGGTNGLTDRQARTARARKVDEYLVPKRREV